MQVNAYLTFSGNCRDAMIFYQRCLGGELFFQTVGESPGGDKMPEQMKNAILHSTLTRGELVITASDMVGKNGLLKGNSVSLLLSCSSEKEIRDCYKKLSHGGKKTNPVERNHYGGFQGNLTDKFGNNWLLRCQWQADFN
jgi:PhnB protein